MNQNMPPQQASTLTLAQINDMLSSAGFPIISRERIETLQSLAPRERIIRAIRLARTDSGARTWLTDLFARAGIAMHQPDRETTAAEPEIPSDSLQGAQEAPHNTSYHEANQSPDQAPMQDHLSRPQYQQSPDRRQQSQGREPQNPQGNREESGRMSAEDRMSVHVYGGKAALCFEADMTKGNVPTIALDAANSTGPRQYDWNGKIRIQLTRAELPVVLAVLIGSSQSCEFKNHGQDNSKGFSMARQEGGKVFIKVFGKDQGQRAVPVMPADVFYVASLFVRQLRKANPWLDSTSIMSMVRATQSAG